MHPRPQLQRWSAITWAAVRRHLGDAGVLLGTAVFVLAAAWCGLLLIRGR